MYSQTASAQDSDPKPLSRRRLDSTRRGLRRSDSERVGMLRRNYAGMEEKITE